MLLLICGINEFLFREDKIVEVPYLEMNKMGQKCWQSNSDRHAEMEWITLCETYWVYLLQN